MRKGFWTVAKQIIKKADVVLEVLDARMPELTRNKQMEKHAARCRKPLILVINKGDLVSPTTKTYLRKRYQNHLLISSKLSKGINELVKMIKSRINRREIRVAVIGYPNTGKSSLINRLSKGGKVRTSSESGFTKGLQLIAGKDNLRLFDTPGVVPFEERDDVRLGLMSGISPSKLKDPEMVACELIKIFKENNPKALKRAYGVDPKDKIPDDFLVEFGRKKNMLKKKGEIDERRAAIQLLIDWHKGKIKL